MGFFSKVWKGIKKTVKKVARGVKKVAKKVVTSMPGGKALWNAGTKLGKGIMKGIGKLGPVGMFALSFVLPGLGSMLGAMWQGFGNIAATMASSGSGIISALGQAGTAVFNGANFVANSVGALGEAVSQGASKLTAPIKNALGDVGKGFMDTMQKQFPDLTKKVTDMTTKFMDTGDGFAANRTADITAEATKEMNLMQDMLGTEAPEGYLKSQIDTAVADTSLIDKAKLFAEDTGITKAAKLTGKVAKAAESFAPKAADVQVNQMTPPTIVQNKPEPLAAPGAPQKVAEAAGTNLFAQLLQEAQMGRGISA